MRRREEAGVGVRHAVVVEGDAVRPHRLGAGGDVVAADRGVFGLVVALDENGVRVKEIGRGRCRDRPCCASARTHHNVPIPRLPSSKSVTRVGETRRAQTRSQRIGSVVARDRPQQPQGLNGGTLGVIVGIAAKAQRAKGFERIDVTFDERDSKDAQA